MNDNKKIILLPFLIKLTLALILLIVIISIGIYISVAKQYNNMSKVDSEVYIAKMQVLVTDNKGEEKYITVNKEDFISQLNSDLYTIYNSYLSENVVINDERAYSILGVYDTINQKLNIIQYLIFYTSEGSNAALGVISIEGECMPYGIITEEGEMVRLIEDDTFYSNLMDIQDTMSNYKFIDSCVLISLIDGTEENEEIDNLLVHKKKNVQNNNEVDMKQPINDKQLNNVENNTTSTKVQNPVEEEKKEITYEDKKEIAKKVLDSVHTDIYIGEGANIEETFFSSVDYSISASYYVTEIDFKIDKVVVVNQENGCTKEIIKQGDSTYIGSAQIDLVEGENTIIFTIYDNYGNTKEIIKKTNRLSF